MSAKHDRLRPLAEEFDDYIKSVFDAGTQFAPDQKRELKRAFMAGAQSLQTFLAVCVQMDDRGDKNSCLLLTQRLEQELTEFPQLVREGKA